MKYLFIVLIVLQGCASNQSKHDKNVFWESSDNPKCDYYTPAMRASLLRICAGNEATTGDVFNCDPISAEYQCRTYGVTNTQHEYIGYSCVNSTCSVIETHRVMVQ
jgi:hypothetical protein